MRNLQTLVKKNHLRTIPDVKFDKDHICAACEASKLAKKHHSSKIVITTTRPLEIHHMDFFSPQNYASSGGSHYGLVIVDDLSHYTWVFFFKDKICT
uniref:GAG-pre-integrase domain-containing protein n=1 Tax=Triticum urartu TaxID=4572 RepID=A0A8R7TG16_TRIUA